MRLGDLDALAKEFKRMRDCNPNDNHFMGYACHFLNSAQEPSTEWECIDNALENAPTIDAIPVEWLRRQYHKYMQNNDKMMCDAYAVVIGEWQDMQNEQEART